MMWSLWQSRCIIARSVHKQRPFEAMGIPFQTPWQIPNDNSIIVPACTFPFWVYVSSCHFALQSALSDYIMAQGVGGLSQLRTQTHLLNGIP